MDLFSYILGKKHVGSSGGGSAVDDGMYIAWDGDTEGKEVIDLSAYELGMFAKVCENVLSAEKVTEAMCVMCVFGSESTTEEFPIVDVVELNGLVIAFTEYHPAIISAKAGTCDLEGVPVEVPADGTYFFYNVVDGNEMYCHCIRKPASE